ncbi:hypothetical protein H1R20_g13301, partial [Candolleomyces eurysporus]
MAGGLKLGILCSTAATIATLFLLQAPLKDAHEDYREPQSTFSEPQPSTCSDRNSSLTDRDFAEVDFPWYTITPTQELIWHACYPSFQCARLSVPLNYSEPRGRQAAIALIRKPSLFPERSRFYKGPVLFNPGGPGGSGVPLILKLGSAFSTVLGPEFDIVSFDPRGIGRSPPRADFFDTDVERALFLASVSSADIGIPRLWAQAHLLGKLAAQHDDGFLEHINTANTATDMLTIARAHGREKLQYWGFSYGSVLGATYAAMYPDNIERLVIDGVMDSEDYYATGWLTNLVDTEKTLSAFFEGCVDAGPDRCPFYAPEPEDIRRNLTSLFDQLRKVPIPFQNSTEYGIVDYVTLRSAVFSSLYTPYTAFLPLAQALKQLAAGDVSALVSFLGGPYTPYKCSCGAHAHEFDVVRDANSALVCNDGDEVPPSLSESMEYVQELEKVSEWADVWSFNRLQCVGWPKNKKEFRGPFVGNTSHPILVVGNTADPVTPLRSAKKMAEGFKGAVVLTQDSPGHCSVNAPSICTQRYIRQYFQDGTLPPPDTVCQPISKNPFPRIPGSPDQAPFDVDEDEMPFLDAVFELSEKFRPALFPLGGTLLGFNGL